MILKHENRLPQAQTMFKKTNINFITEGKRHLGTALGGKNFRDEYTSGKVSDWCDELDRLLEITKSQPQAAFMQHLYSIYSRATRKVQLFHENDTRDA